MIESRITSKGQTTVPRAVRAALGLSAGERLAYEIDGDRVVLTRARPSANRFENPFALFTEWADELDCEAFDNL